VDGDDRVALVVLAREEGADVEVVQRGLQLFNARVDLALDGVVALALGELVENGQVVELRFELVEPADVVVQACQLREQLSGGVGVVP
jgi:hypothetical protein